MTLNPIPVLLSLMHPIAVAPDKESGSWLLQCCGCAHVVRARRLGTVFEHAAMHEVFAGHAFSPDLAASPTKES